MAFSCCGIVIIAGDVLEQGAELSKCRGVHVTVFLKTLLDMSLQLFDTGG